MINLLNGLLEQMEGLKDNPNREQFCVNFDNNFKKDKELYFTLTGKEWKGGANK